MNEIRKFISVKWTELENILVLNLLVFISVK